MAPPPNGFRHETAEADVTIWKEAFFGAEFLLLHASPVYYGLGVPRGDGSGVVLVPGFLGTDSYLAQLRSWLERIGYRPYFSGIGLNAECPNLLIQQRLNESIERALMDTGRKIHLIGHSLGGIIARSVANQRPDDIASVIMLASPFRGTVAHQDGAARSGDGPQTDTGASTAKACCPPATPDAAPANFLDSLRRKMPTAVLETAIYTRDDGVVDWHYCVTGNPSVDFEVPGTHIGLAFNSSVYTIIANRLAQAHSDE